MKRGFDSSNNIFRSQALAMPALWHIKFITFFAWSCSPSTPIRLSSFLWTQSNWICFKNRFFSSNVENNAAKNLENIWNGYEFEKIVFVKYLINLVLRKTHVLDFLNSFSFGQKTYFKMTCQKLLHISGKLLRWKTFSILN